MVQWFCLRRSAGTLLVMGACGSFAWVVAVFIYNPMFMSHELICQWQQVTAHKTHSQSVPSVCPLLMALEHIGQDSRFTCVHGVWHNLPTCLSVVYGIEFHCPHPDFTKQAWTCATIIKASLLHHDISWNFHHGHAQTVSTNWSTWRYRNSTTDAYDSHK